MEGIELGLQGKSVLVLASSKGIGKAIAAQFVSEGARVMISSRDVTQLQKTACELQEIGSPGAVNYQVCDLTDAHQIKVLVEKAVEWSGGVDVLVNNSGGPPGGEFVNLTDQDWQYAFELNLLSYVRTIREALPHMIARGGGRIVNLASISVKEPIEGLILSNTIRSGVVGLAKTLSRELAEDKILINTVGPGRINTERLRYLDRLRSEKLQLDYKSVRDAAEKQIPLGRAGEPEELAKIVVFLCSAANTYLTGQVIMVDGGLSKSL